MAFNLKRRVYEALPITLKRGVGLIPFSVIAGRHYREVYRRHEFYDKATHKQIEICQTNALKKMLEFAVSEVPAYWGLRRVVEKYTPRDALKEFPLLDKDIIQENFESFLPRSLSAIPHYETTTGGTSGNQLKILLDDASQSVEMAFMHRQWARVGYKPSKRKATFRGVPFPNLSPGVYWQQNPVYNELQFSPFHMSEANLYSYVEQIKKFKPSYFHGYPSALNVLAEFVLRHKLGNYFPKIDAVLCGSEGVSLAQRERIERAFNTSVYSWYGHSERLILAGECEHDSSYHHFPDYGVLEIIDEHGCSCDTNGSRGELVGTGLLNYCMPLIRYRTGDYATRLDSTCSCGRNWERFGNVEGRWKQEMLHGSDGARFSLAAINMHGDLFEKVRRFQYIQERPGYCVVNMMVSPEYTEEDRLAIEAAYLKKTGSSLRFEINIVEDIPLTSRGKLKMLVSTLNN